jgi:hypothetical protein
LVEELRYKSKGRGIQTPMRSLNFFLAAQGPGVHSVSNRNEYQKQKNDSGEQSAAGA